MGTRAMNYIALKPGVALDEAVSRYLNPSSAIINSSLEGVLIVYESNFTPMWARTGVNCTLDLEEEVAIQRFLGSLPVADFYMTRAGEAECGHRGSWVDHPFYLNEDVQSIETCYTELTQ